MKGNPTLRPFRPIGASSIEQVLFLLKKVGLTDKKDVYPRKLIVDCKRRSAWTRAFILWKMPEKPSVGIFY
jgi:ABC-type histidine transport system ATPase subunit